MAARDGSMSRRLLSAVLRVADLVVRPAAGGVVLHSQPDLDDTTVALLRAAPLAVPCVVLVDDLTAARRRASALDLPGVRLVSRRSLRGAWRYVRASVTLCTHGLFGSFPRPRRHVVGLWHGEFGKLTGTFAGEPTRHYDWMPVSSELSQSLRSAEFGLPRERVAVVGSPRHDLLAAAAATATRGTGGLRRAVVWAPTFRVPLTGAQRVDGDPGATERELAPDDPELAALLERHGATLWFRAHPADSRPLAADGVLVRAADNASLEELGLTFYDLLGAADCLVTDYSSLWVDHLLCDRPMIAFCPDLDSYRTSRGLALEPHERWFPGPVVQTRADFLAAFATALGGGDEHRAQRHHVRGLLHTTAPGSPAQRVWEHVQDVLGVAGS